ncbi:peptidase M48 [Hwanghaeella grinnelliae]|uniref:Peptidase M48 n=1 Tax=Hwanghaeella grinnelliae TaxID=2500179 RepID=A0A437QU33_9PROT|nr:M48 family metalloprotease [Hwanghaeella grinnelliae]RVU37999.1 peptidase M48 [Hwanghaeella grinnelliae]
MENMQQPRLSRRHFLLGGGCACAASLTGCLSTNRATGRNTFTGFYSIEDDIALGRQEHPKLVKQFGGEYDDPRLQRYVEQIGFKAAQFTEYQFPYKFTIVNSPIINAFALPGGFVYLSRGLLSLASNEAEVAGVLAHELGHVNARHTAERISQSQLAQLGIGVLGLALGNTAVTNALGQVAGLAIQGHSRDQELEADTLGIRYMSRAGYDPDGSVSFLATLREHSMLEAEMNGLPPGSVDEFNIMATHPRTVERVRLAQQHAAEVNVSNAIIGRDPHLGAINGMLYGDDPEQGIIDGNTFVHGPLRFEFTVPDDFLLRNSPTRIAATHQQGAIILFDMAKTDRNRSMLSYIRNVWAPQARFSDAEKLRIDGADAATALTQGNGNGGQVDIRPVAIRGDGETVFRFLFVSPAGASSRFSEGFRRTTYSFRRLSPSEASAIHGRRLVVAPAQPGDSAAALAQTMPFGKFNERAFRVLNDLGPNDNLSPGQLLKIIAA